MCGSLAQLKYDAQDQHTEEMENEQGEIERIERESKEDTLHF